MGNSIGKCCTGDRKPIKPSKPPNSEGPSLTRHGSQVKETGSQIIPEFINSNLAKRLQKKENLFQGLVSTYHGQANPQWKPISDKYFYKGEWSGDKIHGHGFLYDKNQQSLLIGCFYQNNLIPAKYRKIFSNQTQYVGQVNSAFQMHGNGIVTGKSFTYEGQLKNNKFDGEGKLKHGEILFKGTFTKGQKIRGIESTKRGDYEGPFENDQREGQGVFTWKDGGRFQGTFKKNKMHGQGRLFDTQGCYCGIHNFEEGRLLI